MLFWTLGAVWLPSLVLITAASSSDEDSSEKDSEEHSEGSSHPHWKYDDQDAWSTDFKHCSGTSQSPIDINTTAVAYDPKLQKISLEGYDLTHKQSLKLLNNGHTLQLSLPRTMRIVTGFDSVFLAAQLHFHWGTLEVPGSEHTIDDTHFPAEIHVVHYNSKYANFKEAASQSDGLVVLGAFLSIGLHENENYEKILSSIKDVSIEEAVAEIPGFNVRHLLPNKLDKFYRYNGSLTTPPCFQTVNWTIFNESITVSRKQMAVLEETLKADQNQQLSKNFRSPQLLHGRRVLSSFQVLPDPKGPQRNSPYEHNGDPSKGGKSINEHQSSHTGFSRGDILATAFGALFAVTLLSFMMYACQRQKCARFKKEENPSVVYKPGTREEV